MLRKSLVLLAKVFAIFLATRRASKLRIDGGRMLRSLALDTAYQKLDNFHIPSTVPGASQLLHHAPFNLWNFTLHFLILTQHAA